MVIRFIPNLLTLLNLFSGCIAIVLIFNGSYIYSSVLIFVASIFDFFDGTAARLLNAKSEIGKQLDSLSDVVSFGVAPSGILYMLMVNSSPFPANQILNYSALPAFLIAIFSALRLAKFNIDDSQTFSFKGLPTPANALFIASLTFIYLQNNSGGLYANLLSSLTHNYFALLGLTILLSILLVSKLPLMGLKTKSLKWNFIKFKVIFLVLTFILVVFLGFQSSPAILLLYIILSVFERHNTDKQQITVQ